VSLGKSKKVGVLFGLRPLLFVLVVFPAVLLLSLAKRKSGWGICGSSLVGGLVCLFGCSILICLRIWTNCVLVQTSFRLLMLM